MQTEPARHTWRQHPIEPRTICARCGIDRSPRAEQMECKGGQAGPRVDVDYDVLGAT